MLGGEVYYYLPINYSYTKYNEKHSAASIRLSPLDGVVNGSNIYFPLSDEEMNLNDLLVFDSEEEGDGLGEPKELIFNMNENNGYYTLNKSTGVLKRRVDADTTVSNNSREYNTTVTVSVINYGETYPSLSKTFTISTSSVDICSTEKSESVDHINLVKKQDGNTYVYQKNKTEEKEYRILKNGILSSQNDIEITPTVADPEVASATYNKNNYNSDKYVIVESNSKAGSTDLTIEVQKYGFAKDTIKVNVFNFELYSDLAEGNKNISKLNFGGVGENNKTNVKLNFEGPEGFLFDGLANKVEWSIDNQEIATFSPNQDTTDITVTPQKIGQANLRCTVFVENEKLVEMLIPITVSGIEKVNGEEIENNTISFKKDVEKSVDLKYTFGDKTITSYTLESTTIIPEDAFLVTENNNNTFTVTYIGSSDVTGRLTFTFVVGEEKYEDTINITVS